MSYLEVLPFDIWKEIVQYMMLSYLTDIDWVKSVFVDEDNYGCQYNGRYGFRRLLGMDVIYKNRNILQDINDWTLTQNIERSYNLIPNLLSEFASLRCYSIKMKEIILKVIKNIFNGIKEQQLQLPVLLLSLPFFCRCICKEDQLKKELCLGYDHICACKTKSPDKCIYRGYDHPCVCDTYANCKCIKFIHKCFCWSNPKECRYIPGGCSCLENMDHRCNYDSHNCSCEHNMEKCLSISHKCLCITQLYLFCKREKREHICICNTDIFICRSLYHE